MTITRTDLIDQLAGLPKLIRDAEGEVLLAANALQLDRNKLEEARAELLLGTDEDGAARLKGRNEAQRDAELFQATAIQRERIREREFDLAQRRATLERYRNELSALRAVARLLAVEAA